MGVESLGDTSLYALGNTTLSISGRCTMSRACDSFTYRVCGIPFTKETDDTCIVCSLTVDISNRFEDPADFLNFPFVPDIDWGFPYDITGSLPFAINRCD